MIVRLKPLSSFGGSCLPKSDTMFGAVCWGIRLLYGVKDLEDLLNSFVDSKPPFLLSSAFPYCEENKEITYLLPKPIFKTPDLPVKDKKDIENKKKLKKISLVKHDVFNAIINGELTDQAMISNLKAYELKSICQAVDRPRNTINRLSSTTAEGEIFYSEEIYFAKDAGLYFLLDVKDSKWLNKLKAVIRWLGDKGLGGDASVGKGHFQADFLEDTIIREPKSPRYFTTLSLYNPNKQNRRFFKDNLDSVWYKTITRKGRLESMYIESLDVWKKTITLFEEGSTFPLNLQTDCYGENAVVKEEPFRVYHYGFAYPVKGVFA